ncbi:MAG: hypothetical protein WD876_02610 [Candidatus Pacearchaeota archaeon]
MKKILATLALAGTLSLFGTRCDDSTYFPKEKDQENYNKSEMYSFSNFGEIGKLKSDTDNSTAITQIKTSDIDGDGDDDIIIGTEHGRIIIYRNDMVRKK